MYIESKIAHSVVLHSTALDLNLEEVGILQGFQGDPLLIERLIDMGFHENVEIEILGRMPFAGPIFLRCDNTFLALRKEEAQCILIQKK